MNAIHFAGPARGFGYTVSGALLTQVYGIFFVTIQVLSILFLLDFRHSIHRHELNVYFRLTRLFAQGSVLQF